MEIILDYIWPIIAGLAVLAIAGICKWPFSKKKPKSISEVKMPSELFQRIIDFERKDAVVQTIPEGYKENIEDKKNLPKATPEREIDDIGEEKLADAIIALENDDISKADNLFAEIEIREDLAVQRSARAATSRGDIAKQSIRWNDAAEHYAKAARLDPCFETLIAAQKLAYDTGDYDFALSFGLQALRAAIAEYGEKSEKHDIILNNLAGLYTTNKDYHKAELIFNEVLENRTHVLGERHAQIAVTLNNLGTLYREQEQYEKAKPFYEKALDIYEEVFDKNHPYIATTLNNLAELDLKNGEYKKAESRYQRSLNIRLKEFGENHPNTAHGFNNLGGVYCKQGQYKEALPMFQQAIGIVEATLGQEHPQTKLFKRNYELVKKTMA